MYSALSDFGLYGPAAKRRSSDRKRTLGKISLPRVRQGWRSVLERRSRPEEHRRRFRSFSLCLSLSLLSSHTQSTRIIHSRSPSCDASSIEGTRATFRKRAHEKTLSSREREDRGGGAIPLLRRRAFEDSAGGASATLRLRDEQQWILRRAALVAVVGQAVIGAAGERDAVRPASRLDLERRGDRRRRLLLQLLPGGQAAAPAITAASQKARRRSAGWNGPFSVTPVSDLCRRRCLDTGGSAFARGRVARS